MRESLNRNAGPLALLAVVIATVGVCIAGASAASTLLSGKQIKNGSITAVDLHKNSVESKAIGKNAVRSADIGTGQVQARDIGNDQVTSEALDLPAPAQVVVGQIVGSVGPDFGPFAKVASYTKVSPDSVLRIDWSGAIGPGSAANCIFQVRVNGQPPQRGGGEVFELTGTVGVSTSAFFPGLSSGPVDIELWARYSATAGNPSCILDPAPNPGIESTFLISEDVT